MSQFYSTANPVFQYFHWEEPKKNEGDTTIPNDTSQFCTYDWRSNVKLVFYVLC